MAEEKTGVFKIEGYDIPDIAQVIVSTILSCIGFMSNSSTTLIGSMLVSPLGKYTLFRDCGKDFSRSIAKNNNIIFFVNSIIVLVTSSIIGYLMGMRYKNSGNDPVNLYTDGSEFMSRASGTFDNTTLYTQASIALVLGFINSLVKCKPGDNNTEVPSMAPDVIVGFGIATSLLPPLAACGFSYGFKRSYTNTDYSSNFDSINYMYPLKVWFVNYVCITVSSYFGRTYFKSY